MSPPNALPLLLLIEEKAYSISVNPCGPGFRTPDLPAAVVTARAVPTNTSRLGTEDRDRGHLHLEGLDLLAEVLRCASHHEPGDEHGDDREEQHSIEAGADTAVDDLAQLHEPERH